MKQTEALWRSRVHGYAFATTVTRAAATATVSESIVCAACGLRGDANNHLPHRCSYLKRCGTCISGGCFSAWRHRSDILHACGAAACRWKVRKGALVVTACGCVALVEDELY